MDIDNAIKKLKSNYLQIASALPFLDCHAADYVSSGFAGTPELPDTDYIIARRADTENIQPYTLTYYRPEMALAEADFARLAQLNCPVIFRSDENDLSKLAGFVAAHQDLKIILASGERKILYYFKEIRQMLSAYSNFYLCTANFCNWDGLERLCALGLAGQLLYGSFMPLYDPGASKGPLVMTDLPWQDKCAIAGNNLRRLLNIPCPAPTAEIKFTAPEPFIIDAHTHTAITADEVPMETPVNVPWSDWQKFLNKVGIECMFITPCESIHHTQKSSLETQDGLVEASAGRVKFFETFDPRDVEQSVKHLEISLPMQECIGIKLHPSSHRVKADDERFRIAFELAKKYRKPVMSHTWAISSYNPNQIYALPELFEKYLRDFPEVNFIFGHTGGRPESFEEMKKLLNSYHNAYCDIAGDYFHNGFIENLLQFVPHDRILFGSDVNWIDPRCQIGQLIQAQVDDKTLKLILRNNAIKLFNLQS